MPDSDHSSGHTEAEELLALAEEAGDLGVFEWQVREGTVRISPKFLAIYGLTNFDGRYETWLKSIHREDRPRIVGLMDDALASRSPDLHAEFRIVRASDGELRWIEARRMIMYDEQGPVRMVGVSRDVTEQKRALMQVRQFAERLEEAVKERTRELEVENEARRAAEESLRQAQKMEAVGQLTGGVAHDFNNLLTIVMGALELIGRQLSQLPSASPAVARIARARDMAAQGAQRAATLTSRLLAFSRQQALAPQTLDANKLVTGIGEFLRRTLGEAVSIETVLGAGLWRTFADPNQLENALINLALNSRDAMPDGGKLTIETANCYLDQAYVGGLSEPVEPGQYVMIAVADTGAGMDAATVARAFDPFFTTKEVGKGTGLGLSQVYGFVRQTGGHVKIYSELGHGTTVKVYLRRHLGEEEEAPVAQRQAGDDARSIGAETILVVEDDEALRAYTVEILRELGYTVLGARDGPSALRTLEQAHVDLLFTDVVMPGGMNGRQVAEEAMRRKPGLKVLFTTGYTRNAIVHHGRLDADVELIGKPFSFADLSAKVRALLER